MATVDVEEVMTITNAGSAVATDNVSCALFSGERDETSRRRHEVMIERRK